MWAACGGWARHAVQRTKLEALVVWQRLLARRERRRCVSGAQLEEGRVREGLAQQAKVLKA
jgi:hypothetical protein